MSDLEQAIEAFHAALDEHDGSTCNMRSNGVVDGYAEDIVPALLAAGWKPPTTIQCNRCEHFIHEHDAGGCNACSCSLPHGGR